MIVDTSAIVAILRGEPETAEFRTAIQRAATVRISAASYLELGIVLDRVGDPVLTRQLDEVLDALGVTVAEVSPEQARLARAAYRDYGCGSGHPARLNFGDCFSYALAAVARDPLLFKGDDFGHTDVRPAR
ncbi:type II toxin-antitoxin system VapC family toxin [Ruania zhangjianzhongii]|uniref:type II toxin-antitoxin system VapC family toxin n=1 Tax=Ruania zhangjianzhongii TaxID=2603206 RepID=UPI0011C8B360|nr:type II toxin-antitoxin system VapC family toxin [Ruania zhangjianzhongii]